jgi:hypothetical protein
MVGINGEVVSVLLLNFEGAFWQGIRGRLVLGGAVNFGD